MIALILGTTAMCVQPIAGQDVYVPPGGSSAPPGAYGGPSYPDDDYDQEHEDSESGYEDHEEYEPNEGDDSESEFFENFDEEFFSNEDEDENSGSDEDEFGNRDSGRPRDRDEIDLERSDNIANSVRDDAERSGEDGDVVVPSRGSRPEAPPSLTSEIETLGELMDGYDAGDGSGPPSVTTDPGGVFIPAGGTQTPGTTTGPTRTRNPPLGPTVTRDPPYGPTRPRDPTRIPEEEEDIFLTPGNPPPTIYGEELDEEEETCCGMVDGIVYYPYTSDPMEIRDVQAAVHDDRTILSGIMPHQGGFTNVAVDVALPTVGLDFVFQRVYRSDVNFTSGGLLGNHWDFNYNKRIVPVFHRVNADGLGVEDVNRDQAQLYFFNGAGHQDLYKAKHQEWRSVVNFGKQYEAQPEFRAFVTTYESPSHEFLEIQRYIVADPTQHPFRDHPNVHTELGESIFYVVRFKNGERLIFNCRGQMIYMFDRHNNKFDLRYEGPWNPLTNNKMLSSIIDDALQTYGFTPTTLPTIVGSVTTNYLCMPFSGQFPIPRIGSVTDPAGRVVHLTYERGNEVVLSEVRTDYSGRSRTFDYSYGDKDLLTRIIEPKQAYGSRAPAIQNTYDGEGRVTAQVVNGLSYRISHSGGGIRTSLPDGSSYNYGLTDLGWSKVIGNETISGAGSGGGSWTTNWQHNARSQIAAITFPRGNRMEFIFAESNTPVVRGIVRNWKDRGVTYENDLALGNLLSVVKRTHRPNMRAEFSGGQVRVRYGQDSVPNVPDYTTISEVYSYEPLYNQRDYFADAKGAYTTYEFDYFGGYGAQGEPVKINHPSATAPDGSTVTPPPQLQTYSGRGELLTTTSGSEVISRGYNKTSWLTSQSFPDGSRTTYTHRSDGNVMRIDRSPGYAITYQRNEFGHITSERIDPEGDDLLVLYTRDMNGEATQRRQYVKDLVSEADGSRYRVTNTNFGSITVNYQFDEFGRRTQASFAGFDGGNSGSGTSYSLDYTYDRAGRLASVTSPSPAGGTDTETATYDARGLVTSLTSQGETTTYEYDENGNQTGVIDGLGRRTTYVFDGFDRMIAIVDHSGGISSRTLDRNGNVTRIAFDGETGSGTSRGTLSESLFDYDEYNRQIRLRENTFHDGYVTTSTKYDAGHRIVRRSGPGLGHTDYAYDQQGRLLRITDPAGNTIAYVYGSDGNPSTVTRTENVLNYNDATGRFSEGTQSIAVNMTYDKYGNLRTQAIPGQGTTRMWYDSRGLVRTVISGDRKRTVNSYDSMGRLTRLDQNGTSSTFTFNPAGANTRIQAPGRSVERTFNAAGKMLTETNSIANTTYRYSYDVAGQRTGIVDPNGTRTTNTYDSRGRLTRVSANYSSSGVTGPGSTNLRYDGLGRMVEATTGSSIVRRQYDGIGHVIREEQALIGGGSYVLQSSFANDLSERRLTLPAFEGTPARTIRWQFDELGRTTRVFSGNQQVARYFYSGTDRISRRIYGNDVETVWQYDDQGRATNVHVHRYSGGPRIWSANAIYRDKAIIDQRQFFPEDSSGGSRSQSAMVNLNSDDTTNYSESRLVNARSQSVTREYPRFNSAKQLSQSSAATFVNDQLSESRSFSFEYARGKISRATAQVATHSAPLDVRISGLSEYMVTDDAATGRSEVIDYSYDANGNLRRDGQFDYRYDTNNRLISAYMHFDGGRRDNERVEYRYDALGRRISQEFGPKTLHTAQFGRQDLQFIYDGDQVIAEIQIARNGTRSMLADYTPGAQPGEIVQMRRRANDTPSNALAAYYLHEGLNGDLPFVTGSDGTELFRIVSRSAMYLDELVVDGTTTRMPYQSWFRRDDAFTGSVFDETTGMSITDYRRTPVIDEMRSREAFRENARRIADDLARTHLVLMAIAVAPVALPAAGASLAASVAEAGLVSGVLSSPVTWGLVSTGLDYGMTAYVGGDYRIEQGITAFALGYMGASFGNSLAGISKLGINSRIAIEAGFDITSGTVIDYAQNGGKLTEALGRNLLFSAIGAGGSRLSAALAKRQAHRSAAAVERQKVASAVGEDIKVEEFDPGYNSNPQQTGVTEAEVVHALETQFVSRGTNADGTRRQHWFVRRLLEDFRNGTLRWDNTGRTYPVRPGDIVMDPGLSTRNGRFSRGSALTVDGATDRIALNPFNPDGSRVSATQIALTLIHEYLHVIGGNERTARRLQYIAYKRLQQNVDNIGDMIHRSYIDQYTHWETNHFAINRFLGALGGLPDGVGWRRASIESIAQELRTMPNSSYARAPDGRDLYFFNQPKSRMVDWNPQLELLPD